MLGSHSVFGYQLTSVFQDVSVTGRNSKTVDLMYASGSIFCAGHSRIKELKLDFITHLRGLEKQCIKPWTKSVRKMNERRKMTAGFCLRVCRSVLSCASRKLWSWVLTAFQSFLIRRQSNLFAITSVSLPKSLTDRSNATSPMDERNNSFSHLLES